MWWRKALRALGLLAAILLGAPAALWAQGDYLDVSIVKVKPEKVADFEAIGRKIADANVTCPATGELTIRQPQVKPFRRGEVEACIDVGLVFRIPFFLGGVWSNRNDL
jgi:hypothetical protein